MANTSVFTGADGSITLSTPEGLEGEKAQEVLTAYDMISVGRVQDVKVLVSSEVKPFHEIGQRYATELRPGNVSIAGTIGRAYVNGAMLKLLLG
jgi:adenosylcobinamide amidohydrolase